MLSCVDTLYSRDGLMKLIEKRQWQIAMTFVGSDVSMQELLLDHLVLSGEIKYATQLAQRMGIADFQADVSQIASSRESSSNSAFASSGFAGALQGFLELPIDSKAILFCDKESHIQQAMEYFFKDEDDHTPTDAGPTASFSKERLVGLDVEWKPTTSKIAAATGAITTSVVASILQIASFERVFIIDLLALHVSRCPPMVY